MTRSHLFVEFGKWLNRQIWRAALALLGLTAFSLSVPTAFSASLNVGDPAPELHPAEWIKGEPILHFETNRIYVVEFWATWCGPCKANIPHLTELAKKYGNEVAIAGISIWESSDPTDTAYIQKVEKFVKQEGDKMDYRVAVDSPQSDVANAWMKAAGEGGIPASFIVGRDGHIAWIGYPAKMDEALQQVLDGKFDMAAAKSKRDADGAATRPLNDAVAAKDYKTALKLIEDMLAKDPNLAPRYAYPQLIALYHVDLPAGIARGNQILTEQNHDIGIYRMIASIFATQNDLSPAAYNYGQGIIDEALKKGEMGYLFLAMDADVRANLGDKAGAAKCQAEGVAAAEKDVHAPPDFVDSMKKKLATLQAAR